MIYYIAKIYRDQYLLIHETDLTKNIEHSSVREKINLCDH